MALPLGIAVTLMVAASIWSFGSWTAFSHYLGGERCFAETARLDVGVMSKRMPARHVVKLVNCDTKPVVVVGMDKSCGCVTTPDISLPLRILRGSSVSIVILVNVERAKSNEIDEYVSFFVDAQSDPIHINIVGSVLLDPELTLTH